MNRNTIMLAGMLLALNSYTHASLIEAYHQRYLEKHATQPSYYMAEFGSVEQKTFQQLIDHAHPETGTFAQRYFIDETYATSRTAPVFFKICGESGCSAESLKGEIRTLAKKYHARLVALEHRYYGESQPRSSFSTADLQFLTTDAALKDLAALQKYLMQDAQWLGKWVVFGGSYAGVLSAQYRAKYPTLAAGAIASSAPVLAKMDFEEYDEHITQTAGKACAANMRQAVHEIETALNNPTRLAEIKRMFQATDIKNNDAFLSAVADMAAIPMQYGMRDEFCQALEQAATPLIGYASYGLKILTQWEVKPIDLTSDGAMSEKISDYDANSVGMRQWFYQMCTEYGFFQTAHHDREKSSRSRRLNIDYFVNDCKKLFGISAYPDVKRINQDYYSPLLAKPVSRILFTNGVNDPWSKLSLTDENKNTLNPDLNYLLIEGAAHCDDLQIPSYYDSTAMKHAHQVTDALIAKWII